MPLLSKSVSIYDNSLYGSFAAAAISSFTIPSEFLMISNISVNFFLIPVSMLSNALLAINSSVDNTAAFCLFPPNPNLFNNSSIEIIGSAIF